MKCINESVSEGLGSGGVENGLARGVVLERGSGVPVPEPLSVPALVSAPHTPTRVLPRPKTHMQKPTLASRHHYHNLNVMRALKYSCE